MWQNHYLSTVCTGSLGKPGLDINSRWVPESRWWEILPSCSYFVSDFPEWGGVCTMSVFLLSNVSCTPIQVLKQVTKSAEWICSCLVTWLFFFCCWKLDGFTRRSIFVTYDIFVCDVEITVIQRHTLVQQMEAWIWTQSHWFLLHNSGRSRLNLAYFLCINTIFYTKVYTSDTLNVRLHLLCILFESEYSFTRSIIKLKSVYYYNVF